MKADDVSTSVARDQATSDCVFELESIVTFAAVDRRISNGVVESEGIVFFAAFDFVGVGDFAFGDDCVTTLSTFDLKGRRCQVDGQGVVAGQTVDQEILGRGF